MTYITIIYDFNLQLIIYVTSMRFLFLVRMSEPLGVTISVKVFLMIEMSRSKVVEKHAFG